MPDALKPALARCAQSMPPVVVNVAGREVQLPPAKAIPRAVTADGGCVRRPAMPVAAHQPSGSFQDELQTTCRRHCIAGPGRNAAASSPVLLPVSLSLSDSALGYLTITLLSKNRDP